MLMVAPTVPLPAPLARAVSGAAAAPIPKPVPGAVRAFAVAGVDEAALGASAVADGPAALQARPRPAALTAQRTTARFDLVALTWTGALPAGTHLEVRVRESGTWGVWHDLPEADHGPDAGEEGGVSTRASEPLATAGADGVQVRVDSPAGAAPTGLRAMLVDGGRSPADTTEPTAAGSAATATPGAAPSTPAASAAAAVVTTGLGRPAVITRSQWGADERLVKEQPRIDKRVNTLFIHHTDTTNSYSRTQAYAQVRAVYLFHTRGRGWNDIGYNFLVDRYGRVFEGRRGSISAAVHGAHTGGFNTDAIGISALGSFSAAKPTSAMLRGLVSVAAWKSAEWFINPRGKVSATSSGGSSTKYAAGKVVRLNRISGHRDTGYTECPGNKLYPYLPWIRNAVANRLKARLISPSVSSATAAWNGSAVSVRATAASNQRWWLAVTPRCGGKRSIVASGRSYSSIRSSWNLKDSSGDPVPPGVYRLSLISSSPVSSTTFARDVEVLPRYGSAAATCPVTRAGWGGVYTSAVMAGRQRYPSATSVVLVGAASTMDGLIAAPLSAAKAAPVLLTPRGSLVSLVRRDISARKVRTAYIVGTSASVSTAVETQLRALGVTSVVRLSGRGVHATAAAVARQIGAPGGAAVLANGTSFADVAAVAGPAAALKRPILLSTATGLPSATSSAIRALRIRKVLVVGSRSVVRPQVLTQLRRLGAGPAQISGRDRASTAVVVANAFSRPVPATNVVVMSTSISAWSVIGAGQARLTVMSGRTSLPASTRSWLRSRRPRAVSVIGDPSAAATSVMVQVDAAR